MLSSNIRTFDKERATKGIVSMREGNAFNIPDSMSNHVLLETRAILPNHLFLGIKWIAIPSTSSAASVIASLYVGCGRITEARAVLVNS